MRFQGGNSSSQGSPLYLMGEIRHASDWGTGKNNYSLQLASEESMIGGKGDFSSVFTLIPVINPLSVAPPRLEVSPLGESIVTNGGFEECNDDPGKGFVTIDNTQPLYLCSWFVTTNEVEYSGTNLWPPKGGTHSLHLNSAKIAMPASVVQRVPTNNSSNYTLGFYMAGNPDVGCGSSNKTMRVTVTPSSLGMQEFWFDVSNAAEGENWYMEVYPIGFTAYADYVNLTYTSLTSGSCGPVIDNVSMVEIQGALPPLVDPHKAYSLLISGSSSSGGIPKYGEALIAITASSLVVIAGALLFTWIVKKAKKKRGNFNHPSTRRKTMRDKLAAIIDGMHPNNGGKHIPAMSVPQARWWSSINLQQEGGERFKGDAMAVIELSWKQIEKATNNFTTIVGEGGFSTVYRAQLGNGVLGAVKMEKTRDRSRQLFKQELSVLCRLRHPNLVNLLGFCNERDEGILVFEYMAHGSLHQRLHPPAHQLYVPLSWEKRLEVATQIAQGLRYLHDIARPPVVHGDVKSANVLLDDDDNAKICDFGFSLKGGRSAYI
ncbi:hypothetical protein KP509_38G049600 [Ceratopteris richardii]|uniref:Protein kinase domain-containing protein n=1 Tax=Ceratopteris richardii TaxID=49495 RepID=A0A8T2Q4P1_CERRI|nr:hypothetical protein KP509_38G049600 [Ceratopteris richardii]